MGTVGLSTLEAPITSGNLCVDRTMTITPTNGLLVGTEAQGRNC